MFEKKNFYSISELLQENYTDLDIIREKPMVFKVGKIYIVIQPVTVGYHRKFLKDMIRILNKYYWIFVDLEFLSSQNLRDENVITDLISKVKIHSSNRKYKKFLKESVKFISKWGYYAKIKNEKVKRIKGKVKILNGFYADEIIHMLFVMFVYNYDLVKKNCLQFLKMFQGRESSAKSTSRLDTSRRQRERVVMPKFSTKPYSKGTLKIFEKQSKTN